MTTGLKGLRGSGGTCCRGCCLCRCWTKFAIVFWSSASILNCCCWFCSCTVTVSSVFFRLFSCALWSCSLWETSLYCWSSSSESWSIRSGCICWNADPPSGPEGPGTGFFWGLDIVKTSGVAFACVTRVVRILRAEHGDFFAVVTCVARWKRLGAAFTCGARRFSPSVSECARNAPKFYRVQAWKFCTGKRTCSVKNLGRLQTKIFASDIQFNVL